MFKEITNYKEVKKELEGKRILALDLETDSLNKYNGHILEYGSILYDEDGTKVRTTEFLIDPGCKIPQNITDINGISDAMVEGQPKFDEVCELIKGELLAPNQVIMGHNVMFDLGFLYYSLKRCNIDLDPYEITFLCTRNMSKSLNGIGLFDNKGSNRLEHLALNVFDVPDPGHHRSINDVEVCFGVYSKMVDLIYK